LPTVAENVGLRHQDSPDGIMWVAKERHRKGTHAIYRAGQ